MPNFSYYFKDRIFVVITIIVWWECSSQEKTGMKTNSYKKTRSILLLFLFDTQEYNLIQLCLVSFPFCHALNPPQICRRTVYNSETVLYACLLASFTRFEHTNLPATPILSSEFVVIAKRNYCFNYNK